MKNKILSIIGLFLLLLMPIHTYAKTEKINGIEYETMNLEETLKDEGIEISYPDYKETDEQITIYLFRGTGCGYCNAFLTFINSIIEEYGDKFKLKSFEVWQNGNNGELMTEVAEFLEESANGVPFIIIGDKVFPGYANVYDEDIKSAITELYNSKDRYDVFEEIEKAKKMEKIKDIATKCIPIVIVVIIVSIIVYINKIYKKLNTRINELEEKINSLKQDKVKIDKKSTKQNKK